MIVEAAQVTLRTGVTMSLKEFLVVGNEAQRPYYLTPYIENCPESITISGETHPVGQITKERSPNMDKLTFVIYCEGEKMYTVVCTSQYPDKDWTLQIMEEEN
jgi:hypothetical protein